MAWSQADGGWMVVKANSLEEAEEKFENGEFEIQEDLAQAQRNALERDFQEKWGEVDTYYLSDDELRDFKNDCFYLYEQTGFLELFDSFEGVLVSGVVSPPRKRYLRLSLLLDDYALIRT